MHSFVTVGASTGGALLAFAETLDETDGRSYKIELGTKLVLEEAFVAKVEWGFLVSEEKKGRRGDFCLRDVINPHGARFRRGAALKINFFLEPIVQDWRGDAAAARVPALIDGREKFVGGFPGLRGGQNERRRAEQFHFGAHLVLVVQNIPSAAAVFLLQRVAAPPHTLT